MNKITVEISPKTIIFTIGLIIGLIVAWKIRIILIALGISVILMSGFAPLVDWLVKNKVNKTLAVAVTYLLAIGALGLLLFAIIPPLIEQTRLFVIHTPILLGQLSDYLAVFGISSISTESVTQILSGRINDILGNTLGLILGVFTGFLTFVSIAVFSFYLLLEREKIKENLFIFFPHLPKAETIRLAHGIESKLGAWVRGEIILMSLVGFATWVGLSLLRIEFALPLAVIAGLLEAIAVIGPILAAVPAIIVVLASGSGLLVVLGVVALYILIQQVENYFLVPQIMKETVGLSPLVTILALLIGGSLFGIVGAAISVPTAAALQVVIFHLRDGYIKSS
ncbi:MAG: hypothetical protein A3F35_02280 [Candidatus Woykebacteria bacterium RIFCSPHIGHO2_12_FULL_45_10]|uniref:AI-2E family transporter n=1 Tax=Candidatus Woykebacteria bacterium RIFCSPHIGHO2_12_FULL_45_10 TaxID=1802603 RepID=A0A1G1WNL3_9BACT|nr:MAG: hypothetical protein A3F35_02280 [Candidatus Woykebacteria bacterium RIFCSPHIGHO2_12_FULL_45_10]